MTKQYSKPQVIQLGDAVKTTLGIRGPRREFIGRRRQGRSVIDFFAQALLAHSDDSQSRPSLLPQS
jgi:hypothetical protein